MYHLGTLSFIEVTVILVHSIRLLKDVTTLLATRCDGTSGMQQHHFALHGRDTVAARAEARPLPVLVSSRVEKVARVSEAEAGA